MKTKEQAIQEVLIWFDFDYTFKCMMLKDHFAKPLKSFYITAHADPSVQSLKEYCTELMGRAYDNAIKSNGKGHVCTGGFEIVCWADDEHGVDFDVKFVGTDWSTEG